MCIAYNGYLLSRRFMRVKKIYSDLVLLTDSIINEISYFLRPLSQVLITNCEYIDKDILVLFERQLQKGTDFPDAWRMAVTDAAVPLPDSEKEKIISFVISLGKADMEIQLNILKSYRAYFCQMRECAAARSDKYSFTVLVSSFLCGGAIFLIMI